MVVDPRGFSPPLKLFVATHAGCVELLLRVPHIQASVMLPDMLPDPSNKSMLMVSGGCTPKQLAEGLHGKGSPVARMLREYQSAHRLAAPNRGARVGYSAQMLAFVGLSLGTALYMPLLFKGISSFSWAKMKQAYRILVDDSLGVHPLAKSWLGGGRLS
jgi:hypothetical protein